MQIMCEINVDVNWFASFEACTSLEVLVFCNVPNLSFYPSMYINNAALQKHLFVSLLLVILKNIISHSVLQQIKETTAQPNLQAVNNLNKICVPSIGGMFLLLP